MARLGWCHIGLPSLCWIPCASGRSARDQCCSVRSPKRIHDVLGHLSEELADLWRSKWLEAKFAPVSVLSVRDNACESICFAFVLIGEYRAVYVIDGEYQVAAPQLLLALQKSFQFTATLRTLEKAGCDYRNEKGDGIERLLNSLLPLLTPRNVIAILEDVESISALRVQNSESRPSSC